MPPEKGDFNDVLKAQSKEAIRELIVPEIDRLTICHKHNNIKSIGLEIVKSSDALSIDILQKFQNELKSLEKFATTESINTALQVYQQQNMEAFVNYSHKACSRAIEQKIINDLITMQDKFNPNYDLGNVRFCDVVIYDFKGKSYTIPKDYLAAIGKDSQAMQYINPESIIGKEIKNASEVQKNRELSVKLV
ncbi:hypothetical protein [Candidatus Tisiphia endosymbiont of Micropterix aruncella]|uniref:hypothetical protein n=1 Tax=Candidatus Tisiphia endosymbiont of Micropterix aruncella TaxID=3066271 RepID=UPI003AA7D530